MSREPDPYGELDTVTTVTDLLYTLHHHHREAIYNTARKYSPDQAARVITAAVTSLYIANKNLAEHRGETIEESLATRVNVLLELREQRDAQRPK